MWSVYCECDCLVSTLFSQYHHINKYLSACKISAEVDLTFTFYNKYACIIRQPPKDKKLGRVDFE